MNAQFVITTNDKLNQLFAGLGPKDWNSLSQPILSQEILHSRVTICIRFGLKDGRVEIDLAGGHDIGFVVVDKENITWRDRDLL